jgi:hypothetical protein
MVPVMDPDFLRAGMARIAADLSLAGEPIALDAVVERHLDFLLDARAAKLRWPSIARMLAQAGARRADGTAISADQIRASVSRANRRAPVDPAKRATPPETFKPSRESERQPRVAQTPVLEAARPRQRVSTSPIEPDLSDADILAARRRVLGA